MLSFFVETFDGYSEEHQNLIVLRGYLAACLVRNEDEFATGHATGTHEILRVVLIDDP